MEEKSVAEVAEGSVPVANGGPAADGQVSGGHSSKARASTIQAEETGMVFQDVCVDVETKRILWDVSGRAVPGQMLAIMGPSGKPCVACRPPSLPLSLRLSCQGLARPHSSMLWQAIRLWPVAKSHSTPKR